MCWYWLLGSIKYLFLGPYSILLYVIILYFLIEYLKPYWDRWFPRKTKEQLKVELSNCRKKYTACKEFAGKACDLLAQERKEKERLKRRIN